MNFASDEAFAHVAQEPLSSRYSGLSRLLGTGEQAMIRALVVAVVTLGSATLLLVATSKANADPQEPQDPRLYNATLFCLEINNNPTEQGVDNAVANLMNHVAQDADLAISTSQYGLSNLCPMYQDLFNQTARHHSSQPG
jgi:hypothetical protein